MKGTPYLNPDPFCRFIGPRNWGEALIDDKLTTCLLDNGSQLNFVTPTYARERGMDILSLDTLAREIGGQLPPIAVMGGGMIKPEGFVIMNVRVPCVKGYNEDQIAIVLEDPEMKDCPVVLGTPTLFRVMEVIKESEISELAVPWANSRLSWLMRGVHAKMSQLQVKDVANKPIAPLSVDEVVRVTSKCLVPPFGHKVIHGRVGLVLQGYKMNVMTHGLEKRSPLLPLGLEVQSAYATLATGSGPGELLHVDFTSIEETVPLKEEPVIRNVLVLQDHFSKYVVAYVVKDQTARTAAVTLKNGYFGLFGAPAYLVSDQGKTFTGHLITHLCELYGVHKLRTSPYHAQTNGQVKRMNQTIIRMIGKLAEDKKVRWSEHLLELLSAYNGTRSAVTGYSPYYLLFGRKNRMPVDCLFPTLCESPHRTKMEVSVATMQKRLKEAFEVARRLTYEEATKQRRYYDRRAGAVTLQPGDVVMVRTDGFVGKRKVKDRWEDGGFIVESQLGDWPVYKVRCPSADDRQKPKYRILHRNRLLLVTDEDVDDASGQAQAKVTPTLPNATHEALSVGVGSQEPLPSLVTRQGGELTSMVWLNGEFRTKPWTQVVSRATPSPPDLHVDEVSGDESTEPEGT